MMKIALTQSYIQESSMNLKLLLVVSFVVSHATALSDEYFNIRNYEEADKDAVIELALQDPYNLFCGSFVVQKGFMTHDLFISENLKTIEAVLANALQVKKTLIHNGIVIGFVEFYRTREQSLESIKKMMELQGLPFDENQLLAAMPYLKKIDAECEEFALIECIVVSKEHQGKGNGKTLIRFCLEEIKKLWPHLKQVRLDVNTFNTVARKLYESQGFVVSAIQPSHLSIMDVVQYEKELN